MTFAGLQTRDSFRQANAVIFRAFTGTEFLDGIRFCTPICTSPTAKFEHDVSYTVMPTLAGRDPLRHAAVAVRDELMKRAADEGSLPVDCYPSFIRDDDLEFFYRRHSSWEERFNLYPVFRTGQVIGG